MNTIIEKIKAEIERLKEEASIGLSEYDAGHENGICETCNELLSFLSTLESEKPMQEGLEEEIDKRYLQTRVVGHQDGVGEILLGREAFGRIARHFAKWGAEHLKK